MTVETLHSAWSDFIAGLSFGASSVSIGGKPGAWTVAVAMKRQDGSRVSFKLDLRLFRSGYAVGRLVEELIGYSASKV